MNQHMEFVRRIAAERKITVQHVLFGICTKQIRWDNCAGKIVTMSNVGEMVYLTRNKDGSHSAHYDYGDAIISDYLGVDEGVRVVEESEALAAQETYARERREQIARSRIVDDFDDFGSHDSEDTLYDYEDVD